MKNTDAVVRVGQRKTDERLSQILEVLQRIETLLEAQRIKDRVICNSISELDDEAVNRLLAELKNRKRLV